MNILQVVCPFYLQTDYESEIYNKKLRALNVKIYTKNINV